MVNQCFLHDAKKCEHDCSECKIHGNPSMTTMLKYQTIYDLESIEYCCPACRSRKKTTARAVVQGNCETCERRLFK